MGKPNFSYVMKFLCPYCGKTPLKETWFTFAKGCPQCNFSFEREEGYYTAASWMVTFPIVSFLSFLFAGALMVILPHLGSLWIAGISSFFMILFGLVFTPYGMAIWLFWEHWHNPLNHDDSFFKKEDE